MSTFSLQLIPPQSVFIDPSVPVLTAFPDVIVPSGIPIPADIFAALLDVRVPLTIAAIYAVSAHYLNSRSTGQPYAIAKTSIFKAFVILHNVFLAVYSAWTFYGMVTGLHRSLDRSAGLGGAVTSLCKIRSETRVPYYNAIANGTSSAATSFPDASGMPAGGVAAHGLWEEALAYYGWWFYLSKFYEVIDTAIIILKGRKSSLLQTYHHSGAMICMWFGIRYMAPPIWIFCVFNSLIHALMVS